MTRVFYASTLFGAMSLAAAIDAGMFGERSEPRLLIVSNNTNIPEISDGFERSAGFEPLLHRFDEIVRWNDVIAPLHPSDWVPSAAEVPMMSRLMRGHLGLDEPVTELVVESIAVAPARTIGMLLRECPVTVYSDGLMSYGPTRDELPPDIGRRTTRLLHLDLLPSVTPLLLRENDVATEAIPESAFLKVVAELPGPPVDAGPDPMIVGQYLAPLGILTLDEELRLHADMLEALAARGHRRVIFKPHPAAGRAHVQPLQEAAARSGVELTVADDGLPAEVWFAAGHPALVVSCFSTALFTAARYFGLATATMGTELVLNRVTPYENSNRVPATIVDATVPRLSRDGRITEPPRADVSELLPAVGYCMQANRLWDLRDAAVSYLQAHGRDRYFKKRRLERLGLVAPPPYRSRTVRRAARAGRRTASRVRTAWTARTQTPPVVAGRRP
ncbi:MAG: hypothetical protein QOC66_2259 [Pseudonocardiales bacterium]|nr:hypothetical protein [Pseudonocardiales bacterium]